MSNTRTSRTRRNKRRAYIRSTIAGLLVVGSLLTGAKVAAKVVTLHVESSPDYTIENTIGYNNIGEYYNFNVHPNNFVILNISRDNIDITSLRTKLEKCNELGISVGLVLESNVENISDLYLDFDFIQAIITEYDIDLPIYLNIDQIMENRNLNNQQKQAIIEEFVNRAETAKLYYGFNGTDTNITNCNKYIYNLTNHQVYLIQEGPSIEYQGSHTITRDLEGFIKSSNNIAIPNANKNAIVAPVKYTVRPEDTLENISLRFGISINDLLKYNNINELIPNTEIRIPNLFESVDINNSRVAYNFAIARGIDISNYQDTIDWDRVQQTSDYCIIGVARDQREYSQHRGKFLTTSIDQIAECSKRNIPIGLYFSIEEDMKISVYEERMEAYLTKIDTELQARGISINKANIPIFINFQNYYKYNNYYEIMEAVKRVAIHHGYTHIGLYCNEYMLDQIVEKLETIDGQKVDINKTDYLIWRAGGSQYYSTEEQNIGLADLSEPTIERRKPYTIDIEQVTNVCTDAGAANYLGHCNVSYLFNSEVFNNTITSHIYNNGDNTYTLEYDLSNYRNIPISKILHIIGYVLEGLYGILAFTVIGTTLYLKLERKKEYQNTQEYNQPIKK